jgi:hypothetical protein
MTTFRLLGHDFITHGTLPAIVVGFDKSYFDFRRSFSCGEWRSLGFVCGISGFICVSRGFVCGISGFICVSRGFVCGISGFLSVICNNI